ncbi:MBOAT family O-acyltransferase [Magnetococcales bacterium HHB-1]
MSFTNPLFLLFMPIVIGLFLVSNTTRKKQYLLIICSLLFYGYWNWYYIPLLLLSTWVDYYAALRMERSQQWKKYWLLISILSNLTILFFFKYFNFFSEGFAALFHVATPVHSFLIPLGLSFYTFQTISYSVDVYRSATKAEHDFPTYLLFVSFFPQLVSGPIERAKNLLPQLKKLPSPTHKQYRFGLLLILWGLFLKLAIADNMAELIRYVLHSDHYFSSSIYWLISVLAFIQIYCDFMGYSEIARGLGSCLGVKLSLNFRRPFLATSLVGFWQRWHITLTFWLKDYIFIPLIKNAPSRTSAMLGTLFIFVLIGLWHGASGHFILFGLFHGMGIVLYRIMSKSSWIMALPTMVSFLLLRFYMFVILFMSMPIFFVQDITHLYRILQEMITFNIAPTMQALFSLEGKISMVLASVGLLILATKELYEERTGVCIINKLVHAKGAIRFTVAFIMLWLLIELKSPPTTFIYFQF